MFVLLLALLLGNSANATEAFQSTQVYWGDTHVHTSLSADSFAYDNTSAGPDVAYRFARGEAVKLPDGQSLRIDRPLDFLVIADHSDGLGSLNAMTAVGGPNFLQSPVGKQWYQRLQDTMSQNGVETGGELYRPFKALGLYDDAVEKYGDDYYSSDRFRKTIWDDVIDLAEQYNAPGKFTAFIGFEWTSGTVGTMLHRVLVFRDGANKASQVLPFTIAQGDTPESLWRYMDAYQRDTGGRVLAIPHNGNMSYGQLFLPIDATGEDIDANYAATRSRLEPLYEVTQIKGDSETHPLLSPTDEFANFERWRLTDSDPRYEYARSALKLGLQQEQKLGINPFKFGMIGSTDSHTSLTTVEEKEFWGKFYTLQPSPERLTNAPVYPALAAKWSASGLAAVWAPENTREAIFDAMIRKETYATTGPRIVVRFFGGWEFESDDADHKDLAEIGYRKGVPMGGDLFSAPDDESPSFLIRAVKDPDGANLDRVQIIKGWVDGSGESHELVYDVEQADINGVAEFSIVWRDPDFRDDERAFYYVRVIEIPTPRWTFYDEKRYNLELPEHIPRFLQERAYTSPIWYTPLPGEADEG